MDDERRRISDALNRSLSGLKADPLLARRVIAEAKGETKMKKKITGGLILAINPGPEPASWTSGLLEGRQVIYTINGTTIENGQFLLPPQSFVTAAPSARP